MKILKQISPTVYLDESNGDRYFVVGQPEEGIVPPKYDITIYDPKTFEPFLLKKRSK